MQFWSLENKHHNNLCHQWHRNCLPFQSTWVHTVVFSEVRVTQSLVFCKMFSRSLLVLFILGIVLPVLWFTASDYLPLWYLQTFLADYVGIVFFLWSTIFTEKLWFSYAQLGVNIDIFISSKICTKITI